MIGFDGWPFAPGSLPLLVMRQREAHSILAAMLILGSGCIYTPTVEPRPGTWAQPLSESRLENFHQVSPTLYRSARPDADGYTAAREAGINTIVNLRPNQDSQTAAGEIPHYYNIPVRTGSPTYEQAEEFFRIVDNPERQPVMVHCYHGADRTGAFTALYRINRQGWSKDEAIREMTGGGYHFHTMWKNLVDWVHDAPEF